MFFLSCIAFTINKILMTTFYNTTWLVLSLNETFKLYYLRDEPGYRIHLGRQL